MEPRLTVITVEEAGKLFDPPLSRASSYRWARDGGMPGLVRKGRRLFVIREAFLQGLGVTPNRLDAADANNTIDQVAA